VRPLVTKETSLQLDGETVLSITKELPFQQAQLLMPGAGVDCLAAHNNSVFHSSGAKIAWGDLSIRNIEDLAKLSEKYNTVLFVLTEMAGYWNIRDEDRIAAKLGPAKDPYSHSALRDSLPDETLILKRKYIDQHAWLKIEGGECFMRSMELGEKEWSKDSWEDFRASRSGEQLKSLRK
jgi:hypothetical protein